MYFCSIEMLFNSLLKEILDFLMDVDIINLFVVVNGLIGDIEVENWIKEFEWNGYIDNLWNEFFFDLDFICKKLR